MSYAGLGQIIPGATVGRDGSRREAGGAVRVSARWAQRAANAGNRYNFSSAPLIAVDGKAGPITVGALRTLSRQFSSDQPVTNDPPSSRITATVIIPVALETALATKPFVADPPPAAATRRATSSTTASSPTTDSIPGAPPAASPADEIILDEGSAGGLIARYGIWPWAIGGAALAGVGLWFMFGGGTGASVRANRRRRMAANTGKNLWVWDWAGGGWNSARASSKAEATRIAKQMGKPSRGGGMTVTLVPKNVRVAKSGEIARLSSGWD